MCVRSSTYTYVCVCTRWSSSSTVLHTAAHDDGGIAEDLFLSLLPPAVYANQEPLFPKPVQRSPLLLLTAWVETSACVRGGGGGGEVGGVVAPPHLGRAAPAAAAGPRDGLKTTAR